VDGNNQPLEGYMLTSEHTSFKTSPSLLVRSRSQCWSKRNNQAPCSADCLCIFTIVKYGTLCKTFRISHRKHTSRHVLTYGYSLITVARIIQAYKGLRQKMTEEPTNGFRWQMGIMMLCSRSRLYRATLIHLVCK